MLILNPIRPSVSSLASSGILKDRSNIIWRTLYGIYHPNIKESFGASTSRNLSLEWTRKLPPWGSSNFKVSKPRSTGSRLKRAALMLLLIDLSSCKQ